MPDLPTTTFSKPRLDVPMGRTSRGDLVYWDPVASRTFVEPLYERVGSLTAPSNSDLAALVDGLGGDVSGLTSDVTALEASQASQDTHLATIDSEITAIQDALLTPFIPLSGTGTIATDATLGVNFLVSITGTATLANPTGAVDGKTYTWIIKQDATGHPVTLDTKFVKATRDIVSTAANDITRMVATYSATDDKFYVAPLRILGSVEWQTLVGTSGNIDTDLSMARNALVGPLTGNATIRNPTNPVDGETYTWVITQDATGGRTITLGTKFAKSALTFTPDTTASTSTVFAAIYRAINDKYYVFSFQTKVS